jgi:hypothetical protein
MDVGVQVPPRAQIKGPGNRAFFVSFGWPRGPDQAFVEGRGEPIGEPFEPVSGAVREGAVADRPLVVIARR